MMPVFPDLSFWITPSIHHVRGIPLHILPYLSLRVPGIGPGANEVMPDGPFTHLVSINPFDCPPRILW